MKRFLTGFLSCIAVAMLSSAAQAAVIDDFESGSFSSNWESTAGWTVGTLAGDGAGGSDSWASSAAASGALGEFFNDGTTGVSEFFIELDFRIDSASSDRQFNLQVGTAGTATVTNNADINLRIQGGTFAAFAGGWQSIAGLGSITDGDWHSLRIDGSGWGTAGASYDIAVDGGTAVTGLTHFQLGNALTEDAFAFNVNSAFGSNQGFDVDNVNATAVPEPATALLAGLAGLGLIAVRRKR